MALFSTLARKILPRFAPERAQKLITEHLDWATTLGLTADVTRVPAEDPVRVMGLRFPNRIGLAAGFDVEGKCVSALGAFGFGHIEVGTVRPKSHRCPVKHGIRRLAESQAIETTGTPDGQGLAAIAANLRSAQAYALRGGILGLSLAGNSISRETLQIASPMADYLTLSTAGMTTDAILTLLSALPAWRNQAAEACQKHPPVVLKLSPDLEQTQLLRLIDAALEATDGLILTGGTAEIYDGAAKNVLLSGAPVKEKALVALTTAAEHVKGELPLIASGGILTSKDCVERLEAGAALVQLFTGFVTNGPLFVADCVDAAARGSCPSK